MTMLRVGFGQRDITPPLGLPLGGYGARFGGADAVLDRLHARAIVIDDGGAAIAIVALDLVHVFADWTVRVRERITRAYGIASERVLMAATHTHAGPAVFRSGIERDERLATYEHAMIEQVVASVADARQRAKPAVLRFGRAAVAEVAANRREAAMPVDHMVRVLSSHEPNGTLLGVLANFGCHPTVLSAANHAYSGDLLGVAATQAAQTLAAPVVFTNGAAGDVSTRFTRREQTADEVQRLARLLADGVGAAVNDAVEVDLGDTSLGAAVGTVPVRWRALPTRAAAQAEVEAALADLEAAHTRGDDARARRVAAARVEGAQAALWVGSYGGWAVLFGERPPVAQLQALRCGDVSLVAAPGELFSSAGTQLRHALGERVLVIGYANDYLGYFIPEAEAVAGGYEALIAMVDPRDESTICNGLVDVALAAGHLRVTSPQMERENGL
ncbi:MAG: neutral/alkaline non-lysosomal ceramidase N-terminal domain-containing protein [Deltaproteobacteria bacterium]|nr:neutral/alkaline non-lysosomal ceramidase N-terminal domain-containing protein [Deltaproteobacteria bacterium]MBI3387396.1 neutral/alkaline non-lysosomal ceramidase N-terminal domain-containing protein [Deltaproteobacteria bacterium]